MAYITPWVVGSQRNMSYSVLIDGDAQAITGSRYLYHLTSTRSLLFAMVGAMALAGVADPTAVLTRDRKVKLGSSGNFTITWTSTALRDLLGFGVGNLSGDDSYTAGNVSPLLWSPAKPMRPELSPVGVRGISRPLAYYAMSPSDGSTSVVSHGERIDQRYTAVMVDVARVFTPAQAGGEFVRWFNTVVAEGLSFYVYPEVTEEPGSAVTTVLNSGLGPYVWQPSQRSPVWEYLRSRGFDWTDARADITIPCRVVPEYT